MRRALTAIVIAAVATALSPGHAGARPWARPAVHLAPAPGLIRAVQPVAFGRKLVVAAYTEREGQELWVSDRSHRGAHMIESIAPGHRSPGIEDLTSAGDMAFFSVGCRHLPGGPGCGGAAGRRLWVTDGTARGTHPARGAEELSIQDVNPLGDGRVSLYARIDPADAAPTVWIADDTAAGPRLLEEAGPVLVAATPRPLEAGGQVYFASIAGYETFRLWRSDLDGGAAQPLADLFRPKLARFGDRALVLTGTTGPQLLSAGPGDPALTDLGSLGAERGLIEEIAVAGRLAYVSTLNEIWRADGTPGGNELVATTPRRDPDLLGALGSSMVFAEQAATSRTVSIRITDRTAGGTKRLADLGRGSELNCGSRLSATTAGRVWFRVKTRGVGCELWSSDGTPRGTALVREIAPGKRGAAAGDPVPVGNRVYFWADDRSGAGRQLWVARP